MSVSLVNLCTMLCRPWGSTSTHICFMLMYVSTAPQDERCYHRRELWGCQGRRYIMAGASSSSSCSISVFVLSTNCLGKLPPVPSEALRASPMFLHRMSLIPWLRFSLSMPVEAAGTMQVVKPSLAASRTLRSRWDTGRSSPPRPVQLPVSGGTSGGQNHIWWLTACVFLRLRNAILFLLIDLDQGGAWGSIT